MTQDIGVELMLKKLTAGFSSVRTPYQGLLKFERKVSFVTYLLNGSRCCLLDIKQIQSEPWASVGELAA